MWTITYHNLRQTHHIVKMLWVSNTFWPCDDINRGKYVRVHTSLKTIVNLFFYHNIQKLKQVNMNWWHQWRINQSESEKLSGKKFLSKNTIGAIICSNLISEGAYFTCYYYSCSKFKTDFGTSFFTSSSSSLECWMYRRWMRSCGGALGSPCWVSFIFLPSFAKIGLNMWVCMNFFLPLLNITTDPEPEELICRQVLCSIALFNSIYLLSLLVF